MGVQHRQEVDHRTCAWQCYKCLHFWHYQALPSYFPPLLPLFLVFSVAADSSVSSAGQRFSGKISKERKRRRRPTTAITDPRRHMFNALSLLWKSCGNTSIKTMSMKKK